MEHPIPFQTLGKNKSAEMRQALIPYSLGVVNSDLVMETMGVDYIQFTK